VQGDLCDESLGGGGTNYVTENRECREIRTLEKKRAKETSTLCSIGFTDRGTIGGGVYRSVF
jgi:hypothetical protein